MANVSIHRNLHPELHSLLQPFHDVSGKSLRSVWRVYEDGCLAEIILDFENELLRIQANIYDDTIQFELISRSDHSTEGWTDASESEPWKRFIGEMFGWGWIAINQQDALDAILLSFSGIMPQVLVTVVASSLDENLIVASSDKLSSES